MKKMILIPFIISACICMTGTSSFRVKLNTNKNKFEITPIALGKLEPYLNFDSCNTEKHLFNFYGKVCNSFPTKQEANEKKHTIVLLKRSGKGEFTFIDTILTIPENQTFKFQVKKEKGLAIMLYTSFMEGPCYKVSDF